MLRPRGRLSASCAFDYARSGPGGYAHPGSMLLLPTGTLPFPHPSMALATTRGFGYLYFFCTPMGIPPVKSKLGKSKAIPCGAVAVGAGTYRELSEIPSVIRENSK